MELYFTIRATRLRTANPTQLGGIGGIMRAGAGGSMQDGGFDLPKDQRQYAAKNFHRMNVSRNISASVSAHLGCLACGTPHSVGGGGGEIGSGVAKVLSWQTRSCRPSSRRAAVTASSLSESSMGSLVKLHWSFFISLQIS
jgi:hypothetical protein